MKVKKEQNIIFWLMVSPILLIFIFVIVVPFAMGAFYSFTNWSSSARAGEPLKWIGLTNYRESFADPSFIYSFCLTFIYTFLNVIAINITAFFLAQLVTSQIRRKNIYRSGFFIPNLIGGLILGYIWQFIFNNAIPALGDIIPLLKWFSDSENLILRSRNLSVLALVIVGTWQYAGYIMMIYVAALNSVPRELYEAAIMDGAGYFVQTRKITIPMIAQAITVTTFLTLVQSFKQFDVNVSLTAGGPSAVFMDKSIYGTELLALNIYKTAFVGNNIAMGQARAVIFFIVLLIFSLIQVYFNKKKEIEL